MKVVAYTRVSTEEQEAGGYGLDAQTSAIQAEVARRGWVLYGQARDIGSAKDMYKRAQLARTLDELDQGVYDCLMVARLDRLSRSVGDFAAIMARAEKGGWTLVCIDPGVDLSTPMGRAMAGIASVFAQLERELISQRTKEGLEAARRRGVHLGRKSWMPEDARLRVIELREEGMPYRQIAERMELEGWKTAEGNAHWNLSVVFRICKNEGLTATRPRAAA